jgi:sirohydrochlorin cobaltochelatase
MNRTGLILFAHGARNPQWAASFEALAQQLQARRPGLALRLAYLELMQPGLLDAGAQLVDAGCTRVEVLPLFLGSGGHLRNDLPPLLATLRERHAGVHWTLHPAIGEHPMLLNAMADIALATLGET